MRRWNAWGELGMEYQVPPRTRQILEQAIGPGRPTSEATLEGLLPRLPAPRLPEHPLLDRQPRTRLLHAFGQSLPDWIALRGGIISAFPDAVALPSQVSQVAELVRLAQELGAVLIPYGGGTSVLGHINPLADGPPVITVAMGRLNRLLELDGTGCLATFQAGVRGPDLEAALRGAGFTLGHYPQSFEYSTLGGWVATRSTGHFSLGYGRIERLFQGGRVETPRGALVLPPYPASAAGPDLREFLLGSEGRLGIITTCQVKISPLPQTQIFKGAMFPDPQAGISAVRQMAQAGLGLSMIRLSLPQETQNLLSLARPSRAQALGEKWLALRGMGSQGCLLLYGAAGRARQVGQALADARAIIREQGGLGLGQRPGRQWYSERFRVPYLRNALWGLGYALDTVETALPWSRVSQAITAIEQAMAQALEPEGERVYVFSHLSHVYPHGSSLYFTYSFRLAPEPAQNLARWQRVKAAASQAIQAQGGTISHQHGVGLDHKPYMEAEKGPLGLEMIRALCRTLDPQGIMNPGKLLD